MSMSFRMSSSARKIRIGLALLAFASAILGPWWLTLIFGILLAARFRAWEVIAVGILFDLLWIPVPETFSLLSLPWGTLIAVALVFGFEPLRRRLLTGPAYL